MNSILIMWECMNCRDFDLKKRFRVHNLLSFCNLVLFLNLIFNIHELYINFLLIKYI